MKSRGEKISALTAYDYPWARLLDEAGIDVILVGDSLGMVVLGCENPLQVTMDDMIRHTAAVARGAKRAFIVSDMPFMTYQLNAEEAIRNAGRLVQEGRAHSVKVEGGEHIAPTVRRIVDIGIPVVGHVGMTPQSVHAFGGFKMQGKGEENAARIRTEAQVLQEAGAGAVVLEKIPSELAKEITESLVIPTIGIGAGPHCDGQVLVTHDILGMFERFTPPFAKKYADLAEVTLEAFKAYNADVKECTFPEK
ncbi:MAG: 3-methyl-2-oxobutanoate hydroxymethyltransferase [Armatimonadetes bacterium RBG_16_58_9]|nr:MAG: 3-methyl-2-oxobutanoate hydroxymethyltransferase [Armatimonadetes bacterium RBG_16_58_9]